jgi:hypothetical protein
LANAKSSVRMKPMVSVADWSSRNVDCYERLSQEI